MPNGNRIVCSPHPIAGTQVQIPIWRRLNVWMAVGARDKRDFLHPPPLIRTSGETNTVSTFDRTRDFSDLRTKPPLHAIITVQRAYHGVARRDVLVPDRKTRIIVGLFGDPPANFEGRAGTRITFVDCFASNINSSYILRFSIPSRPSPPLVLPSERQPGESTRPLRYASPIRIAGADEAALKGL